MYKNWCFCPLAVSSYSQNCTIHTGFLIRWKSPDFSHSHNFFFKIPVWPCMGVYIPTLSTESITTTTACILYYCTVAACIYMIVQLYTAVQTSMPRFRNWMGNRLRSPDEGADTIVWLCVSSQARDQPNGSFFQGDRYDHVHDPHTNLSVSSFLSPSASLLVEETSYE